ncbi:hypothetical protein [Streptomyces sp. NPDC050704]|uniref:hypothetical protein n=1 Tax=Streptomyces sp. NPDC050704 TaxID=3157219 RepID=UPI00341A5037
MEVDRAAGEHCSAEVSSVEGDVWEVEFVALPGVLVIVGQSEMIADEPDGGVPDFPQGQVGALGCCITRYLSFGGVSGRFVSL